MIPCEDQVCFSRLSPLVNVSAFTRSAYPGAQYAQARIWLVVVTVISHPSTQTDLSGSWEAASVSKQQNLLLILLTAIKEMG